MKTIKRTGFAEKFKSLEDSAKEVYCFSAVIEDINTNIIEIVSADSYQEAVEVFEEAVIETYHNAYGKVAGIPTITIKTSKELSFFDIASLN